jgi:hypothetical protein
MTASCFKWVRIAAVAYQGHLLDFAGRCFTATAIDIDSQVIATKVLWPG